jgi:hypothetical protein
MTLRSVGVEMTAMRDGAVIPQQPAWPISTYSCQKRLVISASTSCLVIPISSIM